MKDEIIIRKIINYLDKIKQAYACIKDIPEHEMPDKMESYALTQLLTNIYELATNIDNMELSSLLIVITSSSIKKCRNIASHDYDSLNWNKVKELCERMLSADTGNKLQKALELAVINGCTGKDYRKNDR